MFEGIKKRAADLIYRSVSYSVRVRNSYEAGKTGGRRLGKWNPPGHGPNAAVLPTLGVLRNRSRDLARNNAWIGRGIRSFQVNEIGCEIGFKSAAPDEEFRKRADDLWERQCKYFDADGQHFSKLLSQIVTGRRIGGEIFIRKRLRSPADRLPVPLQYQLLEAEFCPIEYVDTQRTGRKIYAGIEFDGIGRRTAYWMYRAHPGDGMFFTDPRLQDLVAVPASSIYHHYDPFRPGQLRGVPAIVQALVKAKSFDEYDDAELERKKTRSSYTGMITKSPQLMGEDDWKFDPLTGEPIKTDDAGVPITDVQSGQFFVGQIGEDIKLFEGDNTGAGYEAFVRQQLLGIGAGQDVPYEFISGDFQKTNDRVFRVVLAEYHRTVEQDRWQLTIPQVCYPIWQDFISTAIMAGALEAPADYAANPEPYYKVECHPEGWEYLHELQDANADVVRLKAGLTSRKRILSEQGVDVREVDRENQEDGERAEKMGLHYENATAEDPEENKDESTAETQSSQSTSVRAVRRSPVYINNNVNNNLPPAAVPAAPLLYDAYNRPIQPAAPPRV